MSLVGLTVSAGFLLYSVRKITPLELWDAFTQIHPLFFFSALLVSFSILIWKSFQWRLFLSQHQKIPFLRVFRVVSMWMMGINLLPFWAGEAFAVYLLRRQEKLRWSIGLSVISMDHISEAISLLAVFAVTVLCTPLPSWMQGWLRGIFLGVVLLYFALLFFALRHREKPAREGKRAVIFHFSQWAHNLHVLRNKKKTLVSILWSLAVKGVEILSLYLLQEGLGLSLPFWVPFLVISALNLALTLPLTPGNLGVFEAAVFFVYQSAGVSKTLSLTLALLYHAIYAGPLILTGFSCSLVSGLGELKSIFKNKMEGELADPVL